MQKHLILQKLNMRLPPKNPIKRAHIFRHIKPHLHPFQLPYPFLNVLAHDLRYGRTLNRINPGGRVRDETVLLGTCHDELLEPLEAGTL